MTARGQGSCSAFRVGLQVQVVGSREHEVVRHSLGGLCSGKMSYRGPWKGQFVAFRVGSSFHGPAVSLGSIHAIKKKKISLGKQDGP